MPLGRTILWEYFQLKTFGTSAHENDITMFSAAIKNAKKSRPDFQTNFLTQNKVFHTYFRQGTKVCRSIHVHVLIENEILNSSGQKLELVQLFPSNASCCNYVQDKQ